MAEAEKVNTSFEKIFFTFLITILCLLLPAFILYRSQSSEILSLNTLIPILLIMFYVPLLDLIYHFSFLRIEESDNYDVCEANLNLMFMISFMIGAIIFTFRAFV